MAVADRHGLPVACGIASGQRNEVGLVHETLAERFVEELPERLIVEAQGVEMIAPNLRTRAVQSQDLRKLRRYRRRWLVERLFAWLLRRRRLVTRNEVHATSFLGFLQLACAELLWRRL